MKLLFKQRLFSWLDRYDIYDENGNTVFTVQGKLAFGHCLEIYDRTGSYIGRIKEEVFSFLPRFDMYVGEELVGQIKKEFTFFKPLFTLNCNDWQVTGDWFEWDYQVTDSSNQLIMTASKQIISWTDTYVLDIPEPHNALLCLMIVLAIDAAKCSAGD